MDKDFVAWQKIAGLQIYSKTSLKFGDAWKTFGGGKATHGESLLFTFWVKECCHSVDNKDENNSASPFIFSGFSFSAFASTVPTSLFISCRTEN